ncbi:cadherin-23, partial [Patella vulgata]|uniref:cadherin-23 n=1 Tax=Patella vulgata TaxID=6465 RepID=UPI0024A97A84
TFYLTVLAVDRGNPQPKSSSATVMIRLTDVNDESPEFLHDGESVTVPENKTIGLSIFAFNATDSDTDPSLYYEILWDQCKIYDEKDKVVPRNKVEHWFKMENTTGSIVVNSSLDRETAERVILVLYTEDKNNQVPNTNQTATDSQWKEYFIMETVGERGKITAVKALDREKASTITLIVKANDTSVIGCGSEDRYNISKTSVFINVLDENDNAPTFTKDEVSKGFRSTSDFGTLVLDLKELVIDEDLPINSYHQYKVVGELTIDTNVQAFTSPPVNLSTNGTITTNLKFETSTVGQVSFTVMAYDMAGNDTIDVLIYIIGDKQVLKITLFKLPEEVRLLQDELISVLRNYTGIKFVVDEILSHIDDAGNEVGYKTDLFVHGVKPETGNILDSTTLRSLIDKASSELDVMRSKFKVLQVDNVLKEELKADDTKKEYILIAVVICLALVLVITILGFMSNFNRFKRKLKAAAINVHNKG